MTEFRCSFARDFFPFFFPTEVFPPPTEGSVFETAEVVVGEGVTIEVVEGVVKVVEDDDGGNIAGPAGSGVWVWLEGSIREGVCCDNSVGGC